MKLYSLIVLFLISLSTHAQEVIVSEEDVINQYPFTVQYLNLNVQKENLQMAYMDVLPMKSNGKTVLLLHGKNFSGAYWETTINSLRNEGYRVIVPDQIGFGKSSLPQNIQYSFQLLAQNTKLLLDTLGIKSVYLMGHSMGGMLAIRMTLMYPQVIEKLVLEDPIGLNDFIKRRASSSIDEFYQNELQQDFLKIKEYQLKTYYHSVWKDEYNRWALMLSYHYSGDQKELYAWNSAKIFDMINTQPVVFEIKKIRIPAMIIKGELDPMVPDRNTLQLLSSEIERESNIRLAILDGIGHIPHVEVSDTFNNMVIEFLK